MSEHIFKLPDLGEGTVEAEIAEWHIKVGDYVAEEAVLGAMMTDKAAVEVSAPVSGTVVSLAGEAGDIVAVGAPLVVFETDGKATATDPPPLAPADSPSPASTPEPLKPAPKTAKVLASPAIRRQAKEAGIDLAEIAGSGPRGRIMPGDIDRHRAGPKPAAGPARQTGTEEIKIIGVRRVIADRMAAAKRTIPHFSYVEEIDITKLEDLRQHMNSERSDDDAKLTLLPFISLAIIRGVERFPQCNALHDADRNCIVRHRAVHLGIATQTGDGLKVPVIKHAESRNLRELAGDIARVASAARDNTASKAELSGSTITVSSLGRLGGIVSTPVINAPEVAIIAVNRAVERPVIHKGEVEVRLMMNLSSSFDHRFVDGYDAAEMIQYMKSLLEHPATLFVR